ARRFAERAAPGADGDPRVILDDDVLDGHDEGVAARRAVEEDRPADGVGQGRRLVGAGAPRGDRLVAGRLEVGGAGGVGLNLEALAAAHAQQRLVLPVEGVLPGKIARDALHGVPSLTRGRLPQANSFCTTFPATSVSRKSRPWKRYVSFRWSKPNSCRMVAWKSLTWIGSSTTFQPMSSVLPITCPPFTPPPAIHRL